VKPVSFEPLLIKTFSQEFHAPQAASTDFGHMTYAMKAVLWIVGGPIASVILGYAAFIVFGFVVGAGFDIDDVGTRTEKFFGALALPALGIIALGGSLVSIVVGIRYFLAHRSLSADAFSKSFPSIDSLRKKRGDVADQRTARRE
jgi:hypothetical protein